MGAAEKLGTYAEGWTTGDSGTILSAAADSFVFDDPNSGVIAKADFSTYFAGLNDVVASLRDGSDHGSFMELTEVLTKDDDGVLTASCWWEIPGTPIQGSGLIKVSDDGVLSERIAYYSKLPD